jgi:hypothetical protein
MIFAPYQMSFRRSYDELSEGLGICHVLRRCTYRDLMKNPEGKRQVGRTRQRNKMGECEFDLFGLGDARVVEICKKYDGPPCFIICLKSLNC